MWITNSQLAQEPEDPYWEVREALLRQDPTVLKRRRGLSREVQKIPKEDLRSSGHTTGSNQDLCEDKEG